MQNTATGAGALFKNTLGNDNTATGAGALGNNTLGTRNTATGLGALFSNTTISGVSGQNNTATGFEALASNTIGGGNTAVGDEALRDNTTGVHNTANGNTALLHNTIANGNTAVGDEALLHNTSGGSNTACGQDALFNNEMGSNNIALGASAGSNLTTGSNNIDIGNHQGVADEFNTIRIGAANHVATFIAGISGVNEGNPTAVFINTTTGQLGTTPPASSRRFKDEIKPMKQTSEAILGLKPVTFHYKNDTKGTPQFGLIAEEVAAVNPDLVMRDDKGEIYTVRYEAVNAMLLNEFLKEHRTVQEQQKEIDALKAELKEQRALIQKVNDKVELDRPAPQTVLNNQ